jgi:hypothetical protein
MSWEDFATAFLKDTAGYINDRKDKADDYKDRLLEDAERNKVSLKSYVQQPIHSKVL